MRERKKFFTTKTGADVLGIKQDTLKCYANRYGYGFQPGGPRTPYYFSLDDLKHIRNTMRRHELTESREDREVLELGLLYDENGKPL